jgi:hypothetical protein
VALLVDTHTILSDLDKRANYDQVTVKAKVIRVELPAQVSSNLRKQDVIIADSSATTRLTLWQDAIGQLCVDKSHLFSNFTVRTFRSEKYLSFPKEGASYKDIGDVAIDDLADDTVVVTGAKVAAATLTKYSARVACNSKLEATQFSDDIAQYTKCGMQQLFEKCTSQLIFYSMLCTIIFKSLGI